jgi:hypothetical protein
MTRDELIESALQCGVWIPMAQGQEREQTIDRLQRFVGRAVAAEREACAAICDELESFWATEKDVALLNGDVALSNATSGEPRAARAIAQAIRARGDA